MSRRRSVHVTDVNPHACTTCIFGVQSPIGPERLAAIQAFLLRGTNQICHTTERICRGGRDFQLTCWARLSILQEPTDACLYETMRQNGVTPS